MDGPAVSWQWAMADCHLAAHGFSASQRAEDHFLTSVDIGDHVARVVLDTVQRVAADYAIERPVVVDVGSGRGRLLAQLAGLGHPPEDLIGVDVKGRPEDLPAGVGWVQGPAPEAVPEVHGVLFAHEFLDDVPAQILDAAGQVLGPRGPTGRAEPADREWVDRWGGPVVGRYRDEAWRTLVDRVSVGCAIAVDWMGGSVVGHRRGRRLPPVADGDTDLSAGVDLRSCRALTGGRVVPQHRILADRRPTDPVGAAQWAVLTDRAGLGSFGWLITERPPVGSRL